MNGTVKASSIGDILGAGMDTGASWLGFGEDYSKSSNSDGIDLESMVIYGRRIFPDN